MEDYKLIADTAKRQESLLRFDHFTADDAWNLGVFLAERVKAAGVDMASPSVS